MKLLSHRGWWRSPAEKNTQAAFERSFSRGLGTETDVRDAAGTLVISHDMPVAPALSLQAFVGMARPHLAHPAPRAAPLAINIKADGLAQPLAQAFAGAGLDWFAFDMSVPDMRHHLRVGNPVFGRMSEVERDPPWFDQLQGIWLDGFDGVWFDAELIRALLGRGKRVCVVSPELHGRDPGALWRLLAPLHAAGREAGELMLCTDRPEQAAEALGLGCVAVEV